MGFELRQVPPPRTAPVDEAADRLGLVRGLRVKVAPRQYRCGCCGAMQPAGAEEVWVPDGMRRTDPAWSIEEACRLSANNGSFTAWCLGCAPKAEAPKHAEEVRAKKPLGWLRRLLS